MNLEELRKSGRIAFDATAGSTAYGTNLPTSDRDTRGIFCLTRDEYLDFANPPPEQVGDTKHDVTFYNLRRFIDLAHTANPNILELLFLPKDCINYQADYLKPLFDKRNVFITKKAYFTHGAYAKAQIGKSRGTNKRVHNPKPEARPKREDFCYFIDVKRVGSVLEKELEFNSSSFKQSLSLLMPNIPVDEIDGGIECMLQQIRNDKLSHFPCRPVPVSQVNIDLAKCHASALEHVPYTYRLYDYGDQSKGVFRGDDNLVCESIPVQDEWDNFVGLLVYNKADYEREVTEWKQYWEWVNNRNDARWVDQENGTVDYDSKNMQHCIRLLLSAKHILMHGEPIVRFTGQPLQDLRDIRACKWTYEQIMEHANKIMESMDAMYKVSALPESPDPEIVNKIFRNVTQEFEHHRAHPRLYKAWRKVYHLR